MRDGPWWKQQWLVLDLDRPLISLRKWSCLTPDNDSLAVMADGFAEREREIVRRLLDDAVYKREGVPRLQETRL